MLTYWDTFLASILKIQDDPQQSLAGETEHYTSSFQDTLRSVSDHEHSSHMKNNCAFSETSCHYSTDLDRTLVQLLKVVKHVGNYLYVLDKMLFLELPYDYIEYHIDIGEEILFHESEILVSSFEVLSSFV